MLKQFFNFVQTIKTTVKNEAADITLCRLAVKNNDNNIGVDLFDINNIMSVLPALFTVLK